MHYFVTNDDTKARDVLRNVRVSLESSNPNIPAIFYEIVRYTTSKRNSKYLKDEDYRLAHQYILSNCELLREYEQCGCSNLLISNVSTHRKIIYESNWLLFVII